MFPCSVQSPNMETLEQLHGGMQLQRIFTKVKSILRNNENTRFLLSLDIFTLLATVKWENICTLQHFQFEIFFLHYSNSTEYSAQENILTIFFLPNLMFFRKKKGIYALQVSFFNPCLVYELVGIAFITFSQIYMYKTIICFNFVGNFEVLEYALYDIDRIEIHY